MKYKRRADARELFFFFVALRAAIYGYLVVWYSSGRPFSEPIVIWAELFSQRRSEIRGGFFCRRSSFSARFFSSTSFFVDFLGRARIGLSKCYFMVPASNNSRCIRCVN